MYSTQHTARRVVCACGQDTGDRTSALSAQNQIYRSARHPTQIISHTPRLRALRPLRVILPLTLADLEPDAMTR